MAQHEFERPFIASKDALDTINSVSWFLADAFWMLKAPTLGLGMLVPTVVTGLLLLYVEKRPSVLFINLAINCWIWMNTCWMFSDAMGEESYMALSRGFFIAGLIFIGLSAFVSRSFAETFSHFRRFRLPKKL